jgi:hypothetical protein
MRSPTDIRKDPPPADGASRVGQGGVTISFLFFLTLQNDHLAEMGRSFLAVVLVTLGAISSVSN